MATKVNQNYQWYIINAIGGKEKSIVENLLSKLKTYECFGPGKPVIDIKIVEAPSTKQEIIPVEKMTEKPVDTDKVKWKLEGNKYIKYSYGRLVNKFPSYIFVNMIYGEDIWYIIRNSEGVLGFLGSNGKGSKPIPISIRNYEQVNAGKSLANASPAPSQQSFSVKDIVDIDNGLFKGNSGEISSIDNDNISVVVNINGVEQTVNVVASDISKK